MKRILFFSLFVLFIIIIGAVALTRCNSAPPPLTMDATQQTASTPQVTPSTEIVILTPDSTQSGPVLAAFGEPEAFPVGQMVAVPFKLIGAHDLRSVSVVVFVPVANVRMMDADLNTPEVEAVPGSLPPDASIARNSFDASGRMIYEVTGLQATEERERTLFTMNLAGISPGVGELRVESILAWRADGSEIQIAVSPTLLEITDAAVTIPTPTPIQITLQPVTTPAAGAVSVSQGIYYRIQAGQNLYRVALEFGSTVEAIAQANAIADVHAIPAEKLLYIPVKSPVGRAAYYVAPGDTLYSIARNFNLTVETLAAQNNFQPPYHLRAGQWVVLLP